MIQKEKEFHGLFQNLEEGIIVIENNILSFANQVF